MKIGALRNLTTFTGKHLCQSLFFNKVAGLFTEQLCTTASVTVSFELTINNYCYDIKSYIFNYCYDIKSYIFQNY